MCVIGALGLRIPLKERTDLKNMGNFYNIQVFIRVGERNTPVYTWEL